MKDFLKNDDLKDILEQLNEKEVEIEESEEMKAAKKRYEEYLLKHKGDNEI